MDVSKKLLNAAIDSLNNMEIDGVDVISTTGIKQKKLEQIFLDTIEEILEDSNAWEGEFGDDLITCYNKLISDEDEEPEAEEEVTPEPEVEPEVELEVEEPVEEEEVKPEPKPTKKRGHRGKAKKVVEPKPEPEPEVEIVEPEVIKEVKPEPIVIEPVLEMETIDIDLSVEDVPVQIKVETDTNVVDLINELQILCLKTVAQVDYIKANLEVLRKMV